MPDPDTIIAAPRLKPHPEGGHDLETWRADTKAAVSLEAWTLVGFVVSPGFDLEGWEPGP